MPDQEYGFVFDSREVAISVRTNTREARAGMLIGVPASISRPVLWEEAISIVENLNNDDNFHRLMKKIIRRQLFFA